MTRYTRPVRSWVPADAGLWAAMSTCFPRAAPIARRLGLISPSSQRLSLPSHRQAKPARDPSGSRCGHAAFRGSGNGGSRRCGSGPHRLSRGAQTTPHRRQRRHPALCNTRRGRRSRHVPGRANPQRGGHAVPAGLLVEEYIPLDDSLATHQGTFSAAISAGTPSARPWSAFPGGTGSPLPWFLWTGCEYPAALPDAVRQRLEQATLSFLRASALTHRSQ